MNLEPRVFALTFALSASASAAWAQPLPAPVPPPSSSAPAPVLPPPPPPAARPALPPPPPAVAEVASAPAAPALTGRARRPALMRERLRMLDRVLLPLPERSRDARLTSGLINLAVGAGLVGLGFAPIWGEGSSPSAPQALIWFQGGYNVASGAVELLWAPARERLARDYAAMPIEDARQRRARVRFGEQSLEDIAADGRRRRILSAVSTVAYGLGTLGIFYRAQLFDGEPLPEPVGLNYLVIGSIGIQSIVSVIGALSTSQDERLRDAYQRELQTLRDTENVPE